MLERAGDAGTLEGNEPNERDVDAEDEARDDIEDGRPVIRATTWEGGERIMRRKAFLYLMAVALVISVLGCSGGTSGSVSGKRMSCSGDSLEGGSCKGRFKKLSGTYSADVEVSRSAIHSVNAEVTASVEDGPVRVYLVAPDGTETTAEARPGSPVTVSGPARGHTDEFRVYFEALEGRASGVSFTVSYTYP